MQFLDVTLPTLEENLALDEALLLEAEAGRGGEVLRFWEWPSLAVILGAGCRLAVDVDEAACRADAVPMRRRSSGGGTVLLGPGCLNFSLILAYERAAELREVRPSYRYILDIVRGALLDVEPRLEVAGISDLCVAGRKVSGNAQQRKRSHLLHHGTLLYGFPIAAVNRYLREPERQPEYRGRRVHRDFLGNLAVLAANAKVSLRATWEATEMLQRWPEHEVGRLASDKFARDEWTRRR